MTMRPFTDNRGGLNHLVDAQIGRAFPVVHKVYQHLDAIEYIAQVYESGRTRDIVIRTNHTKEWIEWQYRGEARWTILFKFSDLLGADIADVVAAEQAIAAKLEQLRQQLAADAETVIEARAAATEARLGAEAARDAASVSQAAAAQSVVTATQLAQNLGDAAAAAEASAAAAQADREAAQAAQAVVTSSAQEASTAAVAANAARDSAQGSATEASAAKDATSLLQAAAAQSALAAAQSQTAASDFADAASASATAAALSESTAASHLADLTNAVATTEAAAAASAQHLSAIESQVVAVGLLKEQTETASQAAVDAQAAAEAAVATVTAGVAEVAASTTTATEAATQASNARDTAVSSAVTATEQAATANASRAAAELAAATASAAQLSSGNFLAEVEQFRDLTQVLRNEAETFRDESLTYRNQAEQMQIDAQVVAADRQRAEDAADSIAAAKSKLDGIAPGATANQTDVFLLNRANHAGEQPISTVAGLQDSLDSKQNTLISGISLKTINGVSILGGGDIDIVGVKPSLQGDTTPYVTQTKTYQITNYSSFSSYAVSASAGTASLSGDTITFTAPASAGNVSLTLTVDGQPTVFTVVVQAVPTYIPTPTPTPANFGDPLEGGFYAGMVWGQIAQSSTSMAIAMGSKTFTVPDMTNAPIVYADQQLEVRSRANPANKFVGTVIGAAGTNLTINVTSIGGSGTFSDWSVMARHRVIVAPKASGEHAGIALKNTNTALPTACQTLTEGFAATQAMRDADTSTVYPAAHWVRNLAIGGRTDWYIPARDELELCWRNLKPATADNYAAANRFAAVSFSYANNGSYGDTANTHGTNSNSSPTGAAYTASVPGQTAATAFRTGGAEAYEFGSAIYWSSSDYTATSAWLQYWYSSFSGAQDTNGKTGTFRVRAVRRSII